MKANISEELEQLINEKIYLDLEVHILTKRLNEATQKTTAQVPFFQERLDLSLKKLKQANQQLRAENVKIFEPIKDDIFIQYNYYVKVNGGFKEGFMRYWKDAMKYELKKRFHH
ncbi:hypothetical protein [Bacillus tuaregi]|uniref:hypothetical protein n=1 Tax=Bacillus tuaregi TaxID=1816695 RepID=UPI0008F974E8|nr:hypothetical protein [Bacillus tuaregi]